MKSQNKITGANAGGPRQLAMRTGWAARVPKFCRGHHMSRSILAILAILIPFYAQGFWSFHEVRLEGFRERPWIIVAGAGTNEVKTDFTVVFASPANSSSDEYVFLDLRDEKEGLLSYNPVRGESIQRAMPQEAAMVLGLEVLWKEGKSRVYRFSVNSRLLGKSRVSWQTHPNDENGLPSTGGIVEWCYLSTLVQANRDANKSGTANGSQPIRSETNSTSSAADSRR